MHVHCMYNVCVCVCVCTYHIQRACVRVYMLYDVCTHTPYHDYDYYDYYDYDYCYDYYGMYTHII